MKGDYRSEVLRLFSQINKASYEIIIPQVVLGEAFAQILEKYDKDEAALKSSILIEFIHDNNINVNSCLTPPLDNAFDIMNRLQTMDVQLDRTDIMIVSHALADPNSKFFFTIDRNMLKTNSIQRLEYELRTTDKSRNTDLKVISWLQ